MDSSFETVQTIGLKGLLNKISDFDSFKHPKVLKGMGDDAAVIEFDQDNLLLISSDSYAEGVDFDPVYTPFQHLGYKVLSSAVSDIYAMNGYPQTATVNLGLPNRMSTQMINDLYAGIYSAGLKHEIQVVGGDMKANHNQLVISITVQGIAEKDKVVYRAGAREGDAICVTGDLGGALAGLRILMREKQHWQEHGDESIQPDLADYEFVVKRQLVPDARRDLIEELKSQNLKPGCMIDVTKGLVHELSELADESEKGIYLYQAAIPIAIETRQVADEMQEDVDRYALFGGEDLELVFTLPEKEVEDFVNHFNDFSVIGRVVAKEEGMKMQTAEGDVIDFDDLSVKN